jgi:uncharacterized SAM-binding protein YcdF (DUF218 family)
MSLLSRKRFAAERKSMRKRIALLVALLFLPGCLLFAWLAAELLIVKSDVTSADAIVVLSGSSTYLERTAKAAELYRAGRAPIIILTNDGLIGGWNAKDQRNPYYYELAAKRLEEQGVPADRIRIVTDAAAGTYEESLGIRDYATSHKLNRLLVVTSAYHSRRALWSMRRACEDTGIQVGIDSAPPGWQTPSPWSWWSRRWGWKVVGGEYVKMAYYWTKY